MNLNLPQRLNAPGVAPVAPAPGDDATRRVAVALPATAAPATDALRSHPPSLREWVKVLFRHKAKALAFFIATVAAARCFTSHQDVSYTSDAMLLVRQGRENVSLDPTATTGELIPVHMDWDHTLNSEMAILRSRTVIEEVVDAVGSDLLLSALQPPGPPPLLASFKNRLRALRHGGRAPVHAPPTAEERRDAAIQLLPDAIEVNALDKSDVIRVACTLRNRSLPHRVVSQLLSIYGAKHTAAYSRPGSLEFFRTQTAECKAQLARSEEDLRATKNALGVASLDEQRLVVTRRMADLVAQQEALDARLRASLALDPAVAGSSADVPAGTLPSPDAYRLRRQAQYEAETAYRSLQRESAAVTGHLAAAQEALRTLNDNERRVRELQREHDILEAKYLKYAERQEEARVALALQNEKISNVNVIQAPTRPVGANASNAQLLTIVSLLLGIGGGVGIAFISESMDRSVRRPEDLEQELRIRALGSLPRLSRRQRSLRARGARGAPGGARVKLHEDVAAPFEELAHRLLLTQPSNLPRPVLIGVTSCHAGEGVTTIARHLAVTLVGMRNPSRRSLFVEAPRGPLTGIRGGRTGPRATEFVGQADGTVAAVQQAIGPAALPPGEEAALGETLAEGLVRHARESDLRYVVFDLPPLTSGACAEQLAAMMDTVLVVVESERVRWQTLFRARTRLAEVRADLAGAVLNKRRYYVPDWIYRNL